MSTWPPSRRPAGLRGRVHRPGTGEDPAISDREAPEQRQVLPWIIKTTGLASHFYFYCADEEFGPFFLKFCSYFPYNAKLCINGNGFPSYRGDIALKEAGDG
jgi:hypothetical protein